MNNVTKLVIMFIFCILIVNSLIVSSHFVMCNSTNELKVEYMHPPKIIHIYESDLTTNNEPGSLCEYEKKTGRCECCSSCTDVEIQNENILSKKIEAIQGLVSYFVSNKTLYCSTPKPNLQLNTIKFIDYFPNLTVLRI